MKELRESQIEAKVVKHCRDRGYYYRKFSAMAVNGMPDRLICHGGKALFLELKAANGRLSPLQEREQRLLTAAGMTAEVAYSYEQAVQVIDDFFAEASGASDVGADEVI